VKTRESSFKAEIFSGQHVSRRVCLGSLVVDRAIGRPGESLNTLFTDIQKRPTSYCDESGVFLFYSCELWAVSQRKNANEPRGLAPRIAGTRQTGACAIDHSDELRVRAGFCEAGDLGSWSFQIYV